MTANVNLKTGIAYGYISANALDSGIVDELLYGSGAVDLDWEEALRDWRGAFEAEHDREPDDIDVARFGDTFFDGQCEPTIEGTLDGVRYRSSWLGGALNFFISESPHVTDRARLASPCVPNAGILDTLDGSVTSYDVPADWRRDAGE